MVIRYISATFQRVMKITHVEVAYILLVVREYKHFKHSIVVKQPSANV